MTSWDPEKRYGNFSMEDGQMGFFHANSIYNSNEHVPIKLFSRLHVRLDFSKQKNGRIGPNILCILDIIDPEETTPVTIISWNYINNNGVFATANGESGLIFKNQLPDDLTHVVPGSELQVYLSEHKKADGSICPKIIAIISITPPAPTPEQIAVMNHMQKVEESKGRCPFRRPSKATASVPASVTASVPASVPTSVPAPAKVTQQGLVKFYDKTNEFGFIIYNEHDYHFILADVDISFRKKLSNFRPRDKTPLQVLFTPEYINGKYKAKNVKDM